MRRESGPCRRGGRCGDIGCYGSLPSGAACVDEPRFERWQGNAYAVDLVAIDAFGLRARGLQPVDNHAYRIFGRPVLVPAPNTAAARIDQHPCARVRCNAAVGGVGGQESVDVERDRQRLL